MPDVKVRNRNSTNHWQHRGSFDASLDEEAQAYFQAYENATRCFPCCIANVRISPSPLCRDMTCHVFHAPRSSCVLEDGKRGREDKKNCMMVGIEPATKTERTQRGITGLRAFSGRDGHGSGLSPPQLDYCAILDESCIV